MCNFLLLFAFRWALSTLFVDADDIFPDNITEATDAIDYVNLMPSYGLNVHSMLMHKTLVLTLGALNHLEDRLLRALRRADKVQTNQQASLCCCLECQCCSRQESPTLSDFSFQNYNPMMAAKPMQDIEFQGLGEHHRPMPGDPHKPILW